MARRDASVWFRQALTENLLHVLGALSGVNRRYVSPAHRKRTHRLADGLRVAPARLADRLEGMLTMETPHALRALEELVGEVLELVAREVPSADLGVLRWKPGEREPARGRPATDT